MTKLFKHMLQVSIIQGQIEMSYPSSATRNSINLNTPIQLVVNYFERSFMHLMYYVGCDGRPAMDGCMCNELGCVCLGPISHNNEQTQSVKV